MLVPLADRTGRESTFSPLQTYGHRKLTAGDPGRLYVGKIVEGATKADTEEMIRRHFGEWGEIVKSRSRPVILFCNQIVF